MSNTPPTPESPEPLQATMELAINLLRYITSRTCLMYEDQVAIARLIDAHNAGLRRELDESLQLHDIILSELYKELNIDGSDTDAHFAKLAGEHSGRAVILSRVFVLPADAASYEQMVARAAEGIAIRHGHPWGGCGDSVKHVFRDDAKAALAAIGIAAPRREGK